MAVSGAIAVIVALSTLAAMVLFRPSSLRTGDAANIFVAVNLTAFLICIFLQNMKLIELFNPSFQENGFCVGNPGTLIDSHMLAFYSDTVCAAILFFLASKYKDMAGFAPVKMAAGNVFAHGLGHFGLWNGFLPHSGPTGWERVMDVNDDMTGFYMLLRFAGLALFFIFLLRSVPSISDSHCTFHGLFHGLILTYFCPPAFGFTYVQTISLATSVVYELMRDDKDKFYDLSSLIIAVPCGIVSWLEGMACDNFLVFLGGHFWYDTSIPLSMFAYYAAALAIQPSKQKKEA